MLGFLRWQLWGYWGIGDKILTCCKILFVLATFGGWLVMMAYCCWYAHSLSGPRRNSSSAGVMAVDGSASGFVRRILTNIWAEFFGSGYQGHRIQHAEGRRITKTGVKINLAAVSCGDTEYLAVLLKSVILFSQDTTLHLIVYGDEKSMWGIMALVSSLQKSAANIGLEFTHELHYVWFPPDDPNVIIDWKHMRSTKTCGNQRLFFPSLLPHLDSLIYLDTDIFLMGNLSKVWQQFDNFNDTQLLGMAPDWKFIYNEKKKLPFVPPIGLNSGVMLMNLTRMREFQFEQKIVDVVKTQVSLITEADQDMINFLMYQNPDKIKMLSCAYNFIRPRCEDLETTCSDLGSTGVYIIHGAGGEFKKSTVSLFTHTYRTMQPFQLFDSPSDLLDRLDIRYEDFQMSCSFMNSQLLRMNALKYFTKLGLLS